LASCSTIFALAEDKAASQTCHLGANHGIDKKFIWLGHYYQREYIMWFLPVKYLRKNVLSASRLLWQARHIIGSDHCLACPHLVNHAAANAISSGRVENIASAEIWFASCVCQRGSQQFGPNTIHKRAEQFSHTATHRQYIFDLRRNQCRLLPPRRSAATDRLHGWRQFGGAVETGTGRVMMIVWRRPGSAEIEQMCLLDILPEGAPACRFDDVARQTAR
jgi:hypothetical protein